MRNLINFKLIRLYLIQLHEGTLVLFENIYNNNIHGFKICFYKYCSLHGSITKGSRSPKASVKDND